MNVILTITSKFNIERRYSDIWQTSVSNVLLRTIRRFVDYLKKVSLLICKGRL